MIKNGMRPIHPGEILRVQTAFDLKLTEAEIDSLTKANKTALEKIFKALANSKPLEG